MKNKRKYILYIFILLIIIAGYITWILIGPTLNESEGKYFYVHTGSNYQSVKDSLLQQKIISGTFWFDKIAKYLTYDKAVKPGKYRIKNGMSLVNLVRMLRSGNQSPVNLVITKLRTKEDLAKKLGSNFEFDSLQAIQFINSNDSLSKYDLDTNTVMTAVIPNTYIVKWNNTPSTIFRKLYTEQQKFWTDKRKAQAAALNFSVKEVYTLASIVEEETNEQSDKGKIASVYINRMRKGVRLGADPTIKFAMKDFGLKRIYFKHLSYPSPYNTYRNAGLPPGPICTPSIKTIDAVLNAPPTDYLFFAAKPDFSGYHNFAATYPEHQKFAKAYQLALDSLIRSKQQNQD
ncbi:MAG TPA: endolytic transglycosylase MltG [Chitinophagaceae bacterium]|nr:endolytic transglycosylase MltG [Chitinophagaceae bacterium]